MLQGTALSTQFTVGLLGMEECHAQTRRGIGAAVVDTTRYWPKCAAFSLLSCPWDLAHFD